MGTSLKDIAGWWEEGKAEGAAFMIVVCDTFDHEDYPVWIAPGEDFYAKYDHYNGQNMQRIMEVYDFSKPWATQAGRRAFNLPPRSAATSSPEPT